MNVPSFIVVVLTILPAAIFLTITYTGIIVNFLHIKALRPSVPR